MALEIWLAFAVASLIVLAIPGPTVMLVVSCALGRGRASAWATVPGVALGDITAMTASLLGAGAILAASATFLSLAALNVLLWALLAGQMHARFRRPVTLRLVNRLGGTCLIAAGVFAATFRRA